MTDPHFLQQVPLFSALPAEELARLAPCLLPREYPADEVLFYENEPGDRLSIITQGEVEIIKAMGTPDERTLAVLGPGEIMGEMSLVYRDRQRSASARARLQTHVLEMTQTDFDTLLGRSPQLALRIMQEMSERIRNTEETTIRDLREKNRQLAQAYQELKAAQAQLIERERMEHELKMARQIQQSSLPKELPTLPGWRIAAHWQPAREVSGDFYDFIDFPGGKLGLLVGDVAGKGVPSALVMATTRAVLHAVALSVAQGESISPGALLEQINETLCPDMPQFMFVTCLFAVLDPESGRLCFANAGHPLPYQRTAADVLQPRANGMPLGLIPGIYYEDTEICLAHGESLIMYSDGLVEAHNPGGEMFSFERLQELVAGSEPGPELIALLLRSLAEFTGEGAEQEDDVTLMILERGG